MSKRPPRRRSRQSRDGFRAFTAVELLVAITLATMLMAGILGLLTTLSSHCRQLARDSRGEPWQAILAQLLRRDLANARHVVIAPHRIVLTGYLGTAGLRHDSTLRAAEVTYRLTPLGDIPCLLREERSLDSLSNALASRQLVATGISGFQCTMAGISQADGAYSGPLPGHCRIRFFADSSAVPLFELIWVEGTRS